MQEALVVWAHNVLAGSVLCVLKNTNAAIHQYPSGYSCIAYYVYVPCNCLQVEWLAPLLVDHPDEQREQPQHSVVALTYVLELDAIFVALSSGVLLLLYTATHEVEDVGEIQGGVAAAAWSPDGEAVVIVSNTGNLLLMNKVCWRVQH